MSQKLVVETNPRGIPQAPFIQDVEKHVGGSDAEVDSTLRQFQEAIAKYRYMELNTTQRKKGLLEKIPDIEKTLSMVQYLKSRRKGDPSDAEDDDESLNDLGPMKTTFELNDTLYAEAELEENGNVYLWLGANVMLSYTIEEAISLLSGRLTSARNSLQNSNEDLEYLREQITIMEVNTARCYNWDVVRRREARAAATAQEGGKSIASS